VSGIAAGAGSTVAPFLYGLVALVIIAVVGGAAHIVLAFCDNTKTQRLVDKGTYMSLLGTLIGLGFMVITNIFDALMKFIRIVTG
jgi:uncharacterized membrane-anchored protein